MIEYFVESDEDSVSISLKPMNMESDSPSLDFFCDAFINICVDGNINSPFKNIEDAEVFADAIVKLLESVELFCNG